MPSAKRTTTKTEQVSSQMAAKLIEGEWEGE